MCETGIVQHARRKDFSEKTRRIKRFTGTQTKDFIALLLEYQGKPLEDIISHLNPERLGPQAPAAHDSVLVPMEKDWQRLNQLFGLEMKV